MLVVVIPLVSSFITVGLFITVLGRPSRRSPTARNSWLTGMSGASAVILGIILGAMMGFDLGGPVNKVAYAFATGGLHAAGTGDRRAAAEDHGRRDGRRHGGPLAMALATTVRPQLFRSENGKAAWLLGFSFISACRCRPGPHHRQLGRGLRCHRRHRHGWRDCRVRHRHLRCLIGNFPLFVARGGRPRHGGDRHSPEVP